MNQIKLLKILSMFCIFSLLSACSAVSVKPEQAKNIHRIGVISFLENDFRVYDFGLTIFERRDRMKLDLPEWGLESLVESTVKDELESHSSYTYVPISKRKDIKKQIQESVSGSIVENVRENLVFEPEYNDTGSKLRLLGEANNIDTWILVYPSRSASPIVPRKLFITGVGAIRELTLVGHRAATFAYFGMDVVTANEAEVIAETGSRNSEELDVPLWEKVNALPDSSVPDSLVNSVKEMVSAQLREALTEMKLTK
jgi:hypothetical protein